MCIVWWQNQLGGKLIQSYKWLYRLQPGQNFIIRVVPGCGRFRPAPQTDSKRDTAPLDLYSIASIQKRDDYTASNSTWHQDRRPGAKEDLGYIFAPMTEVKGGTYNVSLDLGTPVVELSITDGNGIEYYR